RCIGLTCHIQPAALVEPSLVLIALWETERDGAGESKRRNLPCLVAVESLHQLERATPHGVKGLCSGHDLPGSEQVDLEPATGKLGDAGHKAFFKLLRCRAAVPQGLHAPRYGRLGVADQRYCSAHGSGCG